jgi:hypothetical protein
MSYAEDCRAACSHCRELGEQFMATAHFHSPLCTAPNPLAWGEAKAAELDAVTKRLQWVYAQCEDPGRTVEQIGRDICKVITGGDVGEVTYPNEDEAIDAAIAAPPELTQSVEPDERVEYGRAMEQSATAEVREWLREKAADLEAERRLRQMAEKERDALTQRAERLEVQVREARGAIRHALQFLTDPEFMGDGHLKDCVEACKTVLKYEPKLAQPSATPLTQENL